MAVLACLRLCLAVFLSACAQPTRFRVVDEVSPDGTFRLVDRTLVTLTDAESVSGEAAMLTCGSRGRVPNAHWIEQEGVAIAADFDSLAFFSAYAHFERAWNFFKDLGVNPSATSQAEVYFTKAWGEDTKGQSDNAAYMPVFDKFILWPQRYLRGIPFAMNVGVIGHEYGHRVFQHEVLSPSHYDRAGDPVDETENLLGSLDEGLSDYFGAVISGNPAFLVPSMDNHRAMGRQRDLSVERVLPGEWLAGSAPEVGSGDPDPYPYGLGAVVASALWAVAGSIGFEDTSLAVLAAERSLARQLVSRSTYETGDFEVLFLGELGPAERAQACPVYMKRYAVIEQQFLAVCQ